ncbi:MAG: DUF2905 domain-containing protein [Acidobacteria bacterium]|nr:DUF2905 domain-containing protein [Acidobacteriota bacterium]
MGRTLLIAGAVIAGLGLAVLAFERLGIPLGRLPGDFQWRGKNTTFYFPLATSLLGSVVLTLVLWLFNRR